MEILERETDIEEIENQISFDFLNDEKTKPILQMREQWSKNDTLVVLVKTTGEFPSNFELCGKTMMDWVAMATCTCKQVIVDDGELLNILKPFADGYKNIAVFYGDTPLLLQQTFVSIMDYFCKENLNVLKLQRGYVFKAEYLQNAKMLLPQNETHFGKDDFVVVDDAARASYAFNVLNGRILQYHKQNGVVLFGEDNIVIDADVQIEQGVTIYPNNVVKGESYIGKNVVLRNGNFILNTIVCDDVILTQSYLENSKIENTKVVGPFTKLINQKI